MAVWPHGWKVISHGPSQRKQLGPVTESTSLSFVLLESPPDTDTSGGVASLLLGVASLLVGVASLLVGVASLLVGVASLLVGVASLLVGVASLLVGVFSGVFLSTLLTSELPSFLCVYQTIISTVK